MRSPRSFPRTHGSAAKSALRLSAACPASTVQPLPRCAYPPHNPRRSPTQRHGHPPSLSHGHTARLGAGGTPASASKQRAAAAGESSTYPIHPGPRTVDRPPLPAQQVPVLLLPACAASQTLPAAAPLRTRLPTLARPPCESLCSESSLRCCVECWLPSRSGSIDPNRLVSRKAKRQLESSPSAAALRAAAALRIIPPAAGTVSASIDQRAVRSMPASLRAEPCTSPSDPVAAWPCAARSASAAAICCPRCGGRARQLARSPDRLSAAQFAARREPDDHCSLRHGCSQS